MTKKAAKDFKETTPTTPKEPQATTDGKIKFTLQNGLLYNLREPINRLMADRSFPAHYSYQLVRLVRQLEGPLKDMEKVRNDLVKKYGTEQDGVGCRVLEPTSSSTPEDIKRWRDFVEELGELMAIEVEVEFNKARIPDTANLSANDILLLEQFIELIELKK